MSDEDAAYSNATQRADAGRTGRDGTGPPGGGDVPATGVASAPGGGTIDAALVGTSTEILGEGSDGGDADYNAENDLDADAVTDTGAGAGTGELDTMRPARPSRTSPRAGRSVRGPHNGHRRPQRHHALRRHRLALSRLGRLRTGRHVCYNGLIKGL